MLVKIQMVLQQHKLVVVDLLLVLMVLVLLVYLLLVLVELMHLVVVQTKKQTDIKGHIQLVKSLVVAQQSGLKNLHTQMQYIFKVVVLLIHLIIMVVVVLDITEVVVQLTQAVILVVLVEVLDIQILHMFPLHL